jgi:putative nucleotidyltransferase with HDIG domain
MNQCTGVEVIENSLPVFPSVVSRILATLDDAEASLSVLVDFLDNEPGAMSRILLLAELCGLKYLEISNACDAISLVGASRVRRWILTDSISAFSQTNIQAGMEAFWRHSLAIGVGSEELAMYRPTGISPEMALVAGLLHDIGKLGLYSCRVSEYLGGRPDAVEANLAGRETEYSGVDHAAVGAWVCQCWGLPERISLAIAHQYVPDAAGDDPMACLLHVAKVLNNALDLDGREESRVTNLSASACKRLGLLGSDARPDLTHLFGRITARVRHANVLFL